ncbi:hypothetical protein SCB49_03960 [unidentified eubacterium SCB49]|nr:hypothetical protein SCB49_03960 [unidentified eubacterium SCB49]
MKQLLLFFFCISTFVLQAQELERFVVEGRITAPSESDIEGVTIYNSSSNRGVITDEEGQFKLAVAFNDVIVVSAIQYATFKLTIDQRTIDKKELGIYLNPVVNQLTEVTVRKYDLTGNLVVDVGSIKTVDLDTEWDLSYETMEFDYEFTPDKWSSIPGNFAESAFYNGQEQYGANLMGGLSLIADIIFNKKASRSFALKPRDPNRNVQGIRERFTHQELREAFIIPEGKEDDFLFFAEDNGLTDDLLLDKNQLVLLAFLQESADAYRKQIDE